MATMQHIDRLILGAGRGDRAALSQLYEETAPTIYAYALTILKNREDAEDVLQECFVTVLRSGSQYKPQGKPMAWLITIVRNLCYKLQRSNARYLPLNAADFFPGNCADPDDRLMVQMCLEKLDQQEQQILILHVIAGCKHREIGQMMEMNTSTVLSKYHRAIRKLRQSL